MARHDDDDDDDDDDEEEEEEEKLFRKGNKPLSYSPPVARTARSESILE